jgi:hypothetical protein
MDKATRDRLREVRNTESEFRVKESGKLDEAAATAKTPEEMTPDTKYKGQPGLLKEVLIEAKNYKLTEQQTKALHEYVEAVRATAVTPPGRTSAFKAVRAQEEARVNADRAAAGLPPLYEVP